MTVVPFDTLAPASKLETGGFSNRQARVIAAAPADALTGRVATTDDIQLLRHDFEAFRVEIHRDMGGLRTELPQDMDAFKAEVRRDHKDIRAEMRVQAREVTQQMTIRLGDMIVVATGILLAASFAA